MGKIARIIIERPRTNWGRVAVAAVAVHGPSMPMPGDGVGSSKPGSCTTCVGVSLGHDAVVSKHAQTGLL